MYLSRLILNPRSRRVQKEIADPYQMHRSLMRAFPNALQEGEERILFRVDVARNGDLLLLVQSWNPPDWAWLDEPGAREYLLRPPETKEFDLHLVPGQTLAFRLRANPTVKRRFESGDHKRVGLYREEEQLEWLKRKGEQGGFRILSVRISKGNRIESLIRRQGEDQPNKLILLGVQFDGLLQVTDPVRLRETVRQGIGSAKGLGFGLLSLARPL